MQLVKIIVKKSMNDLMAMDGIFNTIVNKKNTVIL